MPTYLPALRQAWIAMCSMCLDRRDRARRTSRRRCRSRGRAPSVSCVMSLEPIEKPSKCSQELLGQHRVGRDLAHHDDAQAVLAALQAVGREQLDHLLRLAHGAHERHHDLDVGQPHLVAHVLQRAAFELEAIAEARVDDSATRRGSPASDFPRAARSAGRRVRLEYSFDLKSDRRTITGFGRRTPRPASRCLRSASRRRRSPDRHSRRMRVSTSLAQIGRQFGIGQHRLADACRSCAR